MGRELFTYETLPNNTAASWWRDPGLTKLAFFMATLTISAVGSGVDGSLINGIQIIPQCECRFWAALTHTRSQ